MIKINKQAWDAMVSHVEGTFPKEGCGLMIGADGVVQEAVPFRIPTAARKKTSS